MTTSLAPFARASSTSDLAQHTITDVKVGKAFIDSRSETTLEAYDATFAQAPYSIERLVAHDFFGGLDIELKDV